MLGCCQVAIVNGDRLLGEEAAALKARFPDRVYTQARSLLGLPVGKSTNKLAGTLSKLPYAVTSDSNRGAAQITTHTGDKLLAEELVVSMGLPLKHLNHQTSRPQRMVQHLQQRKKEKAETIEATLEPTERKEELEKSLWRCGRQLHAAVVFSALRMYECHEDVRKAGRSRANMESQGIHNFVIVLKFEGHDIMRGPRIGCLICTCAMASMSSEMVSQAVKHAVITQLPLKPHLIHIWQVSDTSSGQ